jgi:hypothetical protein
MDDLDVRRPRGFRFVDLLGVVCVLIVVAGLALPAIRRTREAADCARCQSNLKQIGLAIHNYASTWNLLPALSGATIQDGIAHPQALLLTILPYIESDIVYPAAMKEPTGRTWKGTLRGRPGPIFSTCFISTFICPADSSNSAMEPTANGWVGSSYAGNAQLLGSRSEWVTDGGKAPEGTWNTLQPDFKLSKIPDGMANTILFAERFALAGSPGNTTPCSWLSPPAGGAPLGAVDAMGCPLQTFMSRNGTIRASVCGPGTFFGSGTKADPVGAIAGDSSVAMYPLPEIGVSPWNAATDGRAQSQHREVVQVVMCDGSVRDVGRNISQVTWVRAICPDDNQRLGEDW